MTQSVFHFKLYNSLLRELCHSATINNRTSALSRIPHSRISKRIRRGRKNIKVYIRFVQNFSPFLEETYYIDNNLGVQFRCITLLE